MMNEGAKRSSGSRAMVAVALGSNLGDRRANLAFGRRELEKCLMGARFSRIYETAPRHVATQPYFLNACCVGYTDLLPGQLLARLQEVERRGGREAAEARFGPRVLDLDLLLYGQRIIEQPRLRVPHPRMTERGFVMVPLAEIARDWIHPECGVTLQHLAERVPRGGVDLYDG
ncbi:MAG: 2-amino-4-hydroxy-6-hydroxymethyldihydropteridine diphosphokinase [Gemmatimonadota bacterium]